MIPELSTELTRLQEEAENGVIAIEGQKDEESLRALGIDADFVKITGSPGSLVETAEEIQKRAEKVILLTDFDHEGRRLTGKLARILQDLGVKVDLSFRKSLKRILRSNEVESFAKEVEKLEYVRRDIHGKGRYHNSKIHNLRKNRCGGNYRET